MEEQVVYKISGDWVKSYIKKYSEYGDMFIYMRESYLNRIQKYAYLYLEYKYCKHKDKIEIGQPMIWCASPTGYNEDKIIELHSTVEFDKAWKNIIKIKIREAEIALDNYNLRVDQERKARKDHINRLGEIYNNQKICPQK